MNAGVAWMMGLAVFIGALLPVQGLVNARLGTAVGGPIVAAFVSFLIGTLGLGLYLLLVRDRMTLGAGGTLPAWLWLGGLLGATYVALVTLLIPRLGTAAVMCLAIFGQVAASLLLERYGVLQAQRPVDWVRIGGAALVVAGAVLVAAPWRSQATMASTTTHSSGDASR